MIILKFVDDSGEIGLLNWYALHPTAMNFYNHLISGDHKGYASLQMERQRGTTYDSADDFVAAFANSDPGDVSPNTNLNNTGPGATDVETTRIMADRQVQAAQQLFNQATEALEGPIDSRRIYVDLSDYAGTKPFHRYGPAAHLPIGLWLFLRRRFNGRWRRALPFQRGDDRSKPVARLADPSGHWRTTMD